jgi:protein TonB
MPAAPKDRPSPDPARPDAKATTPAEPALAEAAPQAAPANSQASGDPATAPFRDDAWQDDYRTALRVALARHHHYPPRARRFRLSGQVTVRFTIRRDGRFEHIELAQSSGEELLDRAALETVQRLGHFQPLPEDYSEDSWTLSVPLVYRRS